MTFVKNQIDKETNRQRNKEKYDTRNQIVVLFEECLSKMRNECDTKVTIISDG
jgi:hypothetical protein